MNILILSNMYPSAQKPYSGLFVVNQVNAIKEHLRKDDILDFYYMERTFTNRYGSIVKYIKFFVNFLKYIITRKVKYDVIHVHYYYPTVYLALVYKLFFNKKTKIIVTFHGFDLYRSRKNLLFTYPFRFVDLCVGVSKKMCEGIGKYYHGKIENISAGINPVFEVREGVKKSFDLIYVGSFYEEKGFDRLCRLLAKYSHRLSVCVIGSGPLEKCLYELIESNKHQILLLNNISQSEIADYLNQSKLIVNVSREESFGLSMAEGMACGLPVIATKTDGSQEQIINHVNGMIVGARHEDEGLLINELTQAVKNMLDGNEFELMSRNAIKTAQKQKLKNISEKVFELYQGVTKTCAG